MKKEEGDATSPECISAEVHNTHIREELNMGKPPKHEEAEDVSILHCRRLTEPGQ
jgi:hypothetical protein